MAKQCPACGKAATGRFCSHCGASLSAPEKARSCTACDSEIPAGGRFCNMCGTPADLTSPSPTAPTGARAALVGGGVLLVAAAAYFMLSRGQSDPLGVPTAPPIAGPAVGPAPAPAGPAAVDLSQMTPREAADRLFDRVMRSVSANDSASARQFAPMAIAAYDMVPDLDLDGRYHVAVLHLVNLDAAGARAAADAILSEVPAHLFGLYTAAQAETMMGNRDEAARLYRRLLENYDAEVAQGRPEYREHQPVLPVIREEAVRGAS